jgi:Xaa-Pro aminopeptidase
METAGLEALLLTKPSNMFYLTGDGRLCAYGLVTREGKVALGVPQTDIEDVKQFGIAQGQVGLEFTFLTQSMMGMLTHPHAKPKELVVKDATAILSELRLVKEPEEIEKMREAGRVAAAGMKAAVAAVKPGLTESQVAAEAEYALRQNGAEDFWRTYVSSGPRPSIAHGLPTARRLETGDLVMIDLHPIVNNYSSDLCRTVGVGKPTPDQQAAYDLYVKAQQATLTKAKAGVDMVDLEETMHGIFKEAGHGPHIFGPPIHGIGINFEESPLPPGHAFFHGEKAPPPLPANVVIAVGNCGLYTGPWGVRVEDTIAVGVEGPSLLTVFPYSLTI